MKGWRNLTADEIVDQVSMMLLYNNQHCSSAKEFKINYTRIGEPFMNIDNLKEAIRDIDKYYGVANPHHYISTIGLKEISHFKSVYIVLTKLVDVN